MIEIIGSVLTLLLIIVIILQLKGSNSPSNEDETTDVIAEKNRLEERNNLLMIQIEKLESERISLQSEKETLLQSHSNLNAVNHSLNEKVNELKEENKSVAEQLKNDFKVLANEIFESKSQKFTETNKLNIDAILSPLKEKIKSFEDKVDKTYSTELTERNTLKVQIEHLVELNKKLSDDANNLAGALKGDVKVQGNWGENLLEKILQHTGLQEGIHYSKEQSFNDDENNRKRPDFIINLPEEKQLIVDSKVSLVAYDSYYSASSKEEKEAHKKSLITSIKNHIDGLSKKDYQLLHKINSPDYVILFVAIEPAYMIALQEDNSLYQYAWNKNILLVSPSNLTAVLKTVSYIWQQENQSKNVLEIARIGGTMYDKFKGFLDDMESIKKNLDRSSESYDKALNKLSSGKGNLVGQAEKIKKLGAKTTKEISKEFVNDKNEQVDFLENGKL